MPKKKEENKENPNESQKIERENNAADGETAKLKSDYDELKNGYLRLAADFENYKKRNNAQNAAVRENVTAEVIEAFLPLADNYELALKYLDDKTGAGVQMIYKQLIDVFARFGVCEMKAEGQFNPVYHEAVESADAEGAESGTILEVLQKGYMQGGKVLRCAMVKIAK
ncbi:MAG: nucleotide exchange factor GrpE [Clostridiales bacterium]|jgi:molecular chaperone GrpE|nr:nucleotide exchange factor GrpE [Clostridiales bacterium]